uniref:Transposase, mutator type n=1 Tax=Tanacetum cinerariifolium TaxID=118510 RepID=A0A699HZZ7_TANCI|nr:transposase, mutator type [Tanacetum cinerariifolium]
MHVYVELVEKDEEHNSDSDSDSDSEYENEIVDEEHVVDEVEVNMNNFKFQIYEEDESSGNDTIVPNVNVTEDNLEVLDFDSLESDLEDVPENARSLGLRKLNKKHSSSKFFISREFANRDLAKDLIRYHAVEMIFFLLVVSSSDVSSSVLNGNESELLTSAYPYHLSNSVGGPSFTPLGNFPFDGPSFTSLWTFPFDGPSFTSSLTTVALNQIRVPAKGRAHCDMLINNVSKVFNRQLLDAKDSPIITALEFVRKYLMKMIVIVQKVIQKCDGPLTPAVAKLFDKIKAASTGCTVEWNGSELYQGYVGVTAAQVDVNTA